MSKRNKKHRDQKKDAAPSQPGEKLRLAREARDLSIEDVSARLKLDTKKINAMEQGDIAGIGTPVFAAGYVRTYARLLELSETEVLADFDELKPEQEAEDDLASAVNTKTYGKVAGEISSQFSLRDKPSGIRFGMLGLVAVFALALTYFMWPDGEVTQTGRVSVTGSNASGNVTEQLVETVKPALAIVAKEEINDTEPVEVHSSLAETQSSAMQSVADKSLQEVEVLESSNAPTPAAIIKIVSDEEKSELALFFNSDSWAEVQDALGNRLIYRLGKTGSRRVVTGVAPFMVQLGFVQGVDISYNGVEYDLSKYANRRSIRLRIGETGDRMSND